MAFQDVNGEIVRCVFAVKQPGPQIQESAICFTPVNIVGAQDSRARLLTLFDNAFSGYFTATANVASMNFGCKAEVIYPHPPPFPILVYTMSNGVLTNALLPTQVRPLITWTTLFAGRKYRGRNFLFTPDSSMSAAATATPAAALTTAMQTLLTAFSAPFVLTGGGNSTSWYPVIAHRPKPPATVWTWDYADPGTYRIVFATQWKSGGTGRINANPW
jgi:hypothetical protein